MGQLAVGAEAGRSCSTAAGRAEVHPWEATCLPVSSGPRGQPALDRGMGSSLFSLFSGMLLSMEATWTGFKVGCRRHVAQEWPWKRSSFADAKHWPLATASRFCWMMGEGVGGAEHQRPRQWV
jgi:hypothetical protein